VILTERVPEDMLAAVLYSVGDLRLEQAPTPEPGPGQALIRVRACGICASDVARIFETGTYRFPLIPGHEIAGEVERVGSGTRGIAPGTRCTVYPLIRCGVCESCRAGLPNLCDTYDYLGSRSDGGFAEYVAAPAENCIALPRNVSFAAGALTEPCAVALHGVRRAEVQPVDVVAVFGAGPIGIVIGLLCRIAGARVVMVDVDERKLAAAREFGLQEGVDGGGGIQPLREVVGAAGAAVAFEAAGAPGAFRDAASVVGKRGTLVLIGNMSGDVALTRDEYSSLLRREASIVGSWNSVPGRFGRDDWEQVLQLMEEGRLPAERLISHRFPLARVGEALAVMRSGDAPRHAPAGGQRADGSHLRVVLTM
jgi:L-iditol 2-dehydrogenase